MTDIDQTIDVGLPGRRYDIRIGRGLLTTTGSAVAALGAARKCAVVTDANVAALYLDVTEESCRAAGLETHHVVLPPGESTKDFSHLGETLDALLAAQIGRHDVVVALGGGVIGDLAGFAAAILRRGVRIVQIPTTLLSQVDSSVGGKTAIDTRFGKNLVGAFHQPSLVLIDLDVLNSLPERQMRAGYAEIAKYGLIRDAAFFAWLEVGNGRAVLGRDAKALTHAVATSCRTKARVVEADEHETTGERALLNLGHTFGHAIEATASFEDKVIHGEAVAVGTIMALTLSQRFGFEEVDRVSRHYAALGLPTSLEDLGISADAEVIYEHMFQDKKVKGGSIAFVLCRRVGEAFVEPKVDRAAVLEALRAGGAN